MQRNNKQQLVLREIKKNNGKTILHLGCTDAPCTEEKLRQDELLHTKIIKWASENSESTTVVGVDINQEGLRMLREAFPGYDIREVNAHTLRPLLHDYPNGFDCTYSGDEPHVITC